MKQTNTLNSENLLELEKLITNVNSLQDKVEMFLPVAQGVLDKANFSLVFVGLIVTIIGVFLPLWTLEKSKKNITDATKKIEERITKDALPKDSEIRKKLINVILSSAEFRESVIKIVNYRNKGERKESENEKKHR